MIFASPDAKLRHEELDQVVDVTSVLHHDRRVHVQSFSSNDLHHAEDLQ
jgi:hypothetical protein